MSATDHALALVATAARAAEDKQGDDLVALDVSELLPFADAFLLVSGRSERQVDAIADEIEAKLLESGAKPQRREGRGQGRWVLLDFGDLVVHVFHEEERMYYALERLWSDCPVISLAGVPTGDQGEPDSSATV